jgi:hypothetical protein
MVLSNYSKRRQRNGIVGENWLIRMATQNPNIHGSEDTYRAARSIETMRKEEGKWGETNKGHRARKKSTSSKKI